MDRLSKTDFLSYLQCPNSFWLRHHKPESITPSTPDAYGQMIMAQGYEVEAAINAWLTSGPNGDSFQTQTTFRAPSGAFARADLVQTTPSGAINIIEVKGSTGVSELHIYDLAFQACVAEAAGHTVADLMIAHVNNAFVLTETADLSDRFILSNQTVAVRALMPDVKTQIQLALELLEQSEIDNSHIRSISMIMRRSKPPCPPCPTRNLISKYPHNIHCIFCMQTAGWSITNTWQIRGIYHML